MERNRDQISTKTRLNWVLRTIGFILTPEALEGLPATYYGGVRVDPQQAIELQQIAFERFPTITVINAADVLEIVQQVVDQIGLVVRFVSGFAILGGIIILASGVMATRFRRIREVAILKTLGATRRRVANMFSAEFLILGSVAGLMGAILASGFSGLLLERVLDVGGLGVETRESEHESVVGTFFQAQASRYLEGEKEGARGARVRESYGQILHARYRCADGYGTGVVESLEA